MPKGITDHDKWKRAKRAVGGKEEGSSYYRQVMAVYKKMGGGFSHKTQKSEELMLLKAGKGPGSRGGKVIGRTKSGKPIYAPKTTVRNAAKRLHDVRYGYGSPTKRDKAETALHDTVLQHVAAHEGYTKTDHREAAARHFKKWTSLVRTKGNRGNNEASAHYHIGSEHKRAAEGRTLDLERHQLSEKWLSAENFVEGLGRMASHAGGAKAYNEAKRKAKKLYQKLEQYDRAKQTKKSEAEMSTPSFEQIFKSEAEQPEDSRIDEEFSNDEGSDMEAAAESSEVEKGDDDEDEILDEPAVELPHVVACPNCATDVSIDEIVKAARRGGAPNKRVMVSENHGGGTEKGSGKTGSSKTGSRLKVKVPNEELGGNVGAYAGKRLKGKKSKLMGKSIMGTPLMILTKSEGPGGDEEIAHEIARLNGIDPAAAGLK